MSVGIFNAETNETKDVANKSRTAIIDSEMSEESQNPLQNRVITQKIAELNQSIEELNGLLGGKLDVTKIANNLVTTEEGYALDARQGKALFDRVTWKYLGQTHGTERIFLTEDWNELFVCVSNTEYWHSSRYIIQPMLSKSMTLNIGNDITIQIDWNNTANINSVVVNGEDVSNNYRAEWFYR